MTTSNSDTSDHAAFFLVVMSHMEDGKINWEAVATDIGITYGRNASTKFNKLIKTYGYKMSDGKVVALAADESAGPAAPPNTPVKKSTKGAARKTAASSSKKRKVEETSSLDLDALE